MYRVSVPCIPDGLLTVSRRPPNRVHDVYYACFRYIPDGSYRSVEGFQQGYDLQYTYVVPVYTGRSLQARRRGNVFVVGRPDRGIIRKIPRQARKYIFYSQLAGQGKTKESKGRKNFIKHGNERKPAGGDIDMCLAGEGWVGGWVGGGYLHTYGWS